MNIDISTESESTMLVFDGDFDATASREARETFDTLLGQGQRKFQIDLTGVLFIDSSALGALVGFLKKIRIGEGDLRLIGVNDSIFKVFELTHLDRVFEIERLN